MSLYEKIAPSNGELCSRVINIGPELAREILDDRNGKNRNKTQSWVNKYSREIDRDNFSQGTPIAFDTDGVLADGQKRLASVVDTEVPQRFAVIFNVGNDYRSNIDQGQPRSLEQKLGFQGLPVNRSVSSGAKYYQLAPCFVTNNNDVFEVMGVVRSQLPRLQWAASMGIKTPSIIGALARASHYVDRFILEDFAESYKTGVATSPNKNAAAIFCRFVLNNKHIFQSGNPSGRNSAYRFAQSAIRSFVKGKQVRRCTEIKTDIFPLPEDAIDFGQITKLTN